MRPIIRFIRQQVQQELETGGLTMPITDRNSVDGMDFLAKEYKGHDGGLTTILACRSP